MTDANGFTFTDPALSHATAEVVRRFNAAFQHKDVAAIRDLVAPDCIMEAMQPAPDGLRVEGYQANVDFWQAMVADTNGSFEVEAVVIPVTARPSAGGTASARVKPIRSAGSH